MLWHLDTTLNFLFFGQGLGEIPFVSRLDAGSIRFEWSVPASGFISIVPGLFPGRDASVALIDVLKAVDKGGLPLVAGKMSWSPGQLDSSMGLVPRFTVLHKVGESVLVAETKTN